WSCAKSEVEVAAHLLFLGDDAHGPRPSRRDLAGPGAEHCQLQAILGPLGSGGVPGVCRLSVASPCLVPFVLILGGVSHRRQREGSLDVARGHLERVLSKLVCLAGGELAAGICRGCEQRFEGPMPKSLGL